MKKVVLLAVVLMSCLIFKSYADDKLVEINNKICPVSHEEVGQNGMAPHKVTYKGKTYNLCCSMCEKDFNKDPEKYVKLMDAEVAGSAMKM